MAKNQRNTIGIILGCAKRGKSLSKKANCVYTPLKVKFKGRK